jgi:hypothetical protein
VTQLLRRHLDHTHAEELAAKPSEGRWTHDFPIDAEPARSLGLEVDTDLADEVRVLMRLYPQPGLPTRAELERCHPTDRDWQRYRLLERTATIQPAAGLEGKQLRVPRMRLEGCQQAPYGRGEEPSGMRVNIVRFAGAGGCLPAGPLRAPEPLRRGRHR